jgi:FkbM family methyltransferase
MKLLIQQIFKALNLDIKIYRKSNHPRFDLVKFILDNKINLVLDIGANDGGFVREIRYLGYKGNVLSFEPLSKAHSTLSINSKSDPNWFVFDRIALGDNDEIVDINISANSVSSSILPMLNSHIDAALNSQYINKEKVNIRRLDNLDLNFLNIDSTFVKIDAQGFEYNIIKGGENFISKSKGIVCELSLIELYDGQKLWIEMINYIQNLGFSIWSVQPGFKDPSTGQLLQLDICFKKI